MTHTPGPWTEEDLGIFDANGAEIAYCYDIRLRANVLFCGRTNEDTVDNARLIATAPELLLFAEQARRVFADLAKGIERSCFHEMLHKADAVITKAIGE